MIHYFKGMPVVLREGSFKQKNILIVMNCKNVTSIEASYLQKFSRSKSNPIIQVHHNQIIPILYFGKYFNYEFSGQKMKLKLVGEEIPNHVFNGKWDLIQSREILMNRDDEILSNLILYERNLPYQQREQDKNI